MALRTTTRPTSIAAGARRISEGGRAGKRCKSGLDCVSAWCTGGVCTIPDCFDGQKNGSETDVDCGGRCAGCGTGQKCWVNDDCLSKSCVESVCAPLM